MTPSDPTAYRPVAEAAWRWVLAQVRWDDGPWIPAQGSPAPSSEVLGDPPADRDGMHSGIGGLAHVLAEIRLSRPWTSPEQQLADVIADRLRASTDRADDVTFFDGLTSTVGALTAIGAEGSAAAIDRVAELATGDGWAQAAIGAPRYLPDARVNDLTLGTAGVLLGALWARRYGVDGAQEVAEHAVRVLLAEAEPAPGGTRWRFVPRRFHVGSADAAEVAEMPNLSHGLAGVAAALAVAGVELGRADLVHTARSGAEHLITLGDTAGDGFVVPVLSPHRGPDPEAVAFGWCHGPTGTTSLFAALERAGVQQVSGTSPREWHRRCLRSVRSSGLPARLRPGFWDNDGRCCGTAGVGEVMLDSWQRTGEVADLAFARRLADVLVERAVRTGPFACWRFVEHRAAEPLLPPGVGWMQGAAGICAYLFRMSRVADSAAGHPPATLARMDTWWTLPAVGALS